MAPNEQGLVKPGLMNHVGKLVDGGKGVVSTFQEGYEALVHAIIRPPRSQYEPAHLGPKRFLFAGKIYCRQDLDVVSNRPDRCILKCSHFKPEPKKGEVETKRPVVIFLHGNAASRQEGLGVIKTVLAASADLFLFDFGGSGMSEGDYVSLGHFEKEDLDAVVHKLRCSGVPAIGLWGRSMGAVTALLYAVRDAQICGMVVDSPFTDLRTLAGELCEQQTYGAVPAWLSDAALSVIKVSIQNKAGFDLDELCPIDLAASTNIPALFAAAVDDDFIYPHHAKMIQEEFYGQSRLLNFEGDHNSDRPQEFLDEVRKFFMRTLHGSYRSRDIWELDKEIERHPPDGSRPSQGHTEAQQEAARRYSENVKKHKDALAQSSFGAGAGAGSIDDFSPIPMPPPPEPTEAEKQQAMEARKRREAREELAARELAKRRQEEQLHRGLETDSPSPRRRTGGSSAREISTRSGGGGYNASQSHPLAAPSVNKQEIKQQLAGLGFTSNQIDAALLRNSTIEGCVEWILSTGI